MTEKYNDSQELISPPLSPLAVKVGNLIIGGNHPISVQTMWKFPLKGMNAELKAGVEKLGEAGCDLLRFAVPDIESARILGKLAGEVKMPLVADIHYDYKLALLCLDYPIAKIRINPGNIGATWKVEEVVKKAADKGVPLRVGVNGGSLPPRLRQEPDTAMAMLKAAEEELEILEKLEFRNVLFSLKSSDIGTTLRANRLFAASHPFPLHLGVTEAGPLIQGIVKSTVVFSDLLRQKIGSTLRVSLSDTSLNEIIAGKQIIRAVRREKRGVDIVSCPTCGRTVFDVKGFLRKVEGNLNRLSKNLTVAVMGCPVNGPGEARHADLGITGSGPYIILFKKGKIIDKIKGNEKALQKFLEELDKF